MEIPVDLPIWKKCPTLDAGWTFFRILECDTRDRSFLIREMLVGKCVMKIVV